MVFNIWRQQYKTSMEEALKMDDPRTRVLAMMSCKIIARVMKK